MSPDSRDPKRVVVTAATALAALAIGGVTATPTFLAWNSSPSVSEGLYWIEPKARISNGDLVLAWAPLEGRMLAARRAYLPASVPLIKKVAASEGDTVCGLGPLILINGRAIAERSGFDPSGRAMPSWKSCRTLGSGELFLLGRTKQSFDGRYFGPIGRTETLGKAVLLWQR